MQLKPWIKYMQRAPHAPKAAGNKTQIAELQSERCKLIAKYNAKSHIMLRIGNI
jgi:hypothetical protein